MDVSVISNRVYQKVRDSMRGQFRRRAEVNTYRQVRVEVLDQLSRHTGHEIYYQVFSQIVRGI